MATLTTFEVDLSGFDLLVAGLEAAEGELGKALRDGMNDSVRLVNESAHQHVRRRTGRLASSIGAKFLTPLSTELIGSVGVAMRPPPYGDAHEFAPYAGFIEKGTPRHEIRARGRARGGKNALWWKGARHPVKRVDHPGNEAMPYLKPALTSNEGRIKDIFRDAVQRVLHRISKGGV